VSALGLAWHQLRSAWLAGEVRVLLLALVLAVGAMTAVGFFTDRIQSVLNRQGSLLLGADMVVIADHAIPEKYRLEAAKLGLNAAQTLDFPSMVVHGDASHLAEIKAINGSYPLRGELTIAAQAFGAGRNAQGAPQSGSVWIEPRLASLLGVALGDSIAVGERQLRVAALLQHEPARGGDMFNIAPHLLMNEADIASTKLIQYGSRVKYQLLLAGNAATTAAYSGWIKPLLARGERLQDVKSARPEIRSVLEKTQQFLGLASMASVILAMVAMSLASLPFVQGHLDTFALMRCFGASRRLIMHVLVYQALLLGLIGSLLGCVLGYMAQAGLAVLVGSLFVEALPPPSWTPALAGLIAGLAAMLGVVWPHLQRLGDVPALRILRRDLGDLDTTGWLAYLPGLAVMGALIFWHAHDLKLGLVTLAGLLALLLVSAGLVLLGGRLLHQLPLGRSSAWKLGIAGLMRRPAITVAQVIGLSLGLMALILLALVRGDLLHSWQSSLPADAPNRFIINIQPDQIAGMQSFLSGSGIGATTVLPMVRGRLIAVNDKPLVAAQYKDDRARRLVEREFNLSWTAQMRADNRILAGRWWRADEQGKPLLSLEQGIAETLGIELGDRLTYDVGGTPITLSVTSLRKVEWDSMRVNFFAVAPPGVLDQFPASYITSFHLPLGQEATLNHLVKRFPNLTIIDVAALMQQVRGIMDKMVYAVQYVFGFSLLAGLAVLYAALVATREERTREATLLRVLGASRRQVVMATMAEFFCMGLLAAVIATLAASVLAYYISVHLLDIPYAFNFGLAMIALASACVLVPLAAWLGVSGLLNQAPRQILHSV